MAWPFRHFVIWLLAGLHLPYLLSGVICSGLLACSMMDPAGTTHAAASLPLRQVPLEAKYAFASVQGSFSALMNVYK